MKKNFWIILALLVMLMICGYIWALIFRPAFVQPVTDFFVNLKNGSQEQIVDTGTTNTGAIEVEKKIEEPWVQIDSEKAEIQTTATGTVEDIVTDDHEIILDTGMTEKEIISKIEENKVKRQELEKNSTWVLIRSDYKAEYITSKEYKNDSIKLIISWKEKTINFWYNKSNAKYCKNGPEDCTRLSHFEKFIDFSPDKNYLLFEHVGYESTWLNIIDIEKNTFLSFDSTYFESWLSDGRMVASSWRWGTLLWVFDIKNLMKESLPIDTTDMMENNTMRWSKTQEIFDRNAHNFGGFVSSYWFMNDDKYWYLWAENNDDNTIKQLKIYDLKTLKEVYSKEIK